MLRIKNNVDLNILKDYGFKNTRKYTWMKDEIFIEGDCKSKVAVVVNPTNTRMANEIVYFLNNDEDLKYLHDNFINAIGTVDVLYDLIKAGLVEKIQPTNDCYNLVSDIKHKVSEINHKQKTLERLSKGMIKDDDIKKIGFITKDLMEACARIVTDLEGLSF